MKAKPTFYPLHPDGTKGDELVEFTPFIYLAGAEKHRLALHKDLNRLPATMKAWVVSDPISGAQIARVLGTYKGALTSSRGFGVREARTAAMETLDRLLERIGSEAFNVKLAEAHQQYGTLAQAEAA